MPLGAWRRGACALAAFAITAALQAWPLPLSLGTRLTGPPSGDTGVYVWNNWVFRHELTTGRTVPLRTLEILPLDGPTDLSLHNYTVFSNLLALPLQPWLGVVATFNVVYMVNVALAGFGMYLLARRLTGGRTLEAWIAGLVFACSPFLVARSAAHFSLVAAAPLPFFMLLLLRAWDTHRIRDAAAAGLVVAWAAFSDPYYAVYCLMLAVILVGSRIVAVRTRRRPSGDLKPAKLLVNAGIVGVALVVLIVNVAGGGRVEIGSMRISLRTLYTPVFLLTVLVVARLALSARFQWALRPLPPFSWMRRALLAAGIVAALLLSPQLIALGQRALEGRLVSAPVLWRSSPPGVDLVALALPNPAHPLAPAAVTDWLASRPNGYVDQVASLSWVGLGLMLFAWRRASFRPDRVWIAITIGFALLSLGPFIQIAGLNTRVPTPWALLRYVPFIGSARMPSRMAIVTTLGFCVLLALALAALTARFPRRRMLILSGAAAALAFELVAAPRVLYSAEIPSIFRIVKADPRPIRVLELPTGIRDGLSSMGDFSASAQFHQTFHEKGLIGGYLSRVSRRSKAFHRRMPVLDALMTLGERRRFGPHRLQHAREAAADFLQRGQIGYVVMHTDRVTPELRSFAMDAFALKLVMKEGTMELYVPGARE